MIRIEREPNPLLYPGRQFGCPRRRASILTPRTAAAVPSSRSDRPCSPFFAMYSSHPIGEEPLLGSVRPAPPVSALGQHLHHLFGQQPWDFLEAAAPPPGAKPQWRTVTAYPLKPRILWQRWQDPHRVIGVRFDRQTRYGLVDIDVNSPYCHPQAIAEIRAALETIGLVRTLIIRSSHSGGLHLYLPLPEPVKTFDLAVALHHCLGAQGFAIAKGTLEIFPNPKPYGVEKIIHYNGHRLPLQPGTGSCLLDDDLTPIGDNLDHCFRLWDIAASHQDLHTLRHALKIGRDNHRKRGQQQRQHRPRSEAWRQDLEAEIADGWGGPGQTNHLLKTIACHGHVFLGRSGDDLVQHTLKTALNLPGYGQHCRHQHHIATRVRAWCQAVQHYYWPQGSEPKRPPSEHSPRPTAAQQQSVTDARDRIAQAVTTLQQQGSLVAPVRHLAQRLAAIARCSFATLYKHLDLWHPGKTTHPPAPAPPTHHAVQAPRPLPDQRSQPALKTPHPLATGVLHPLPPTMKCGDGQSSPQKHPPHRGVRGDKPRFPQVPAPADLSYDRHYRPLPPLAPSASPEERDRYVIQTTLRQCAFQLGWGYPQLQRYIAEQFHGRRFYQLGADDITRLIDRLQTLTLSRQPAPALSPPAHSRSVKKPG